jgi:hypothetical protein
MEAFLLSKEILRKMTPAELRSRLFAVILAVISIIFGAIITLIISQ